jgi:hypothetical protein
MTEDWEHCVKGILLFQNLTELQIVTIQDTKSNRYGGCGASLEFKVPRKFSKN